MFADYSRYTRSVRGSAIAVFLGLARHERVDDAARRDRGARRRIRAIRARCWTPSASALRARCCLTLATLTTNFVNIYMSSLAWKSLAPRARRRRRRSGRSASSARRSAPCPGVWLEQYTNFMMRARRAAACRSAASWSRTTTFGRPRARRGVHRRALRAVGTVSRRLGRRRGRVGGRRRGVLRGRVDRRHAAGAGGLGPRLPRAADTLARP